MTTCPLTFVISRTSGSRCRVWSTWLFATVRSGTLPGRQDCRRRRQSSHARLRRSSPHANDPELASFPSASLETTRDVRLGRRRGAARRRAPPRLRDARRSRVPDARRRDEPLHAGRARAPAARTSCASRSSRSRSARRRRLADAKKQVLRAQYTSAVGLRLAFFLSQGVLSSRVSGSSDIDEPRRRRLSSRLCWTPSHARASRTRTATSGISCATPRTADLCRTPRRRRCRSSSKALSTCIVNLFRDELAHLEAGTYKFPYDLNPATAPASQWNPVDVFALSRDTLSDQSNVSKRRDEKAGQELLETFSPDPERYPAYYLQNFHYQTDGWLSADSASVRFSSRDAVPGQRGYHEAPSFAVCR